MNTIDIRYRIEVDGISQEWEAKGVTIEQIAYVFNTMECLTGQMYDGKTYTAKSTTPPKRLEIVLQDYGMDGRFLASCEVNGRICESIGIGRNETIGEFVRVHAVEIGLIVVDKTKS